MQEKVFGLVGKSISYSFSPDYFNEKFRNLGLKDHTYKIFDLESIDSIEELKQVPEIAGLNVTIPYKQAVIPYLDELHDSAYDIGAVNTIKIVDGKWIGYNTDYLGFEDVLDLAVAKIGKPKRAIILGSGGASNAVQYVLEKRKISYITISRKGIYTYENISDEAIANSQLIINTTPLGTYPNIEDCPKIDYSLLSEKHCCIDLIYNPKKTVFLTKSEAQGAAIFNGLTMLVGQAEHAWDIWNTSANQQYIHGRPITVASY